MSIIKSILHKYNATSKAYDTMHPETESAQVKDWHQAVKNSVISEDIKSEILQFQTTLSQETVPSGNTGALTSLLSGIVHQIAALSGKTNWWETPKNSFETLSAGVVAGDVSDPNSWWVKLGGTIPLIIQGGKSSEVPDNSSLKVTLPISFNKPLCAVANFSNKYPYKDWVAGLYVVMETNNSILLVNDPFGNNTCNVPAYFLCLGT